MKKAIQIAYNESFEKKCKIASEAGFKYVSVNFNDTPIPSDDTYDKAPNHILGIFEKYGLEAVQTHLFYYYPLSTVDQTDEDSERRILREIEVSGKIGAQWCVWHPRYFKIGQGDWETTPYDEERTLYYNKKTLPRYVQQAKKFNTGLAIENLFGSMMYGGFAVLEKICDNLCADNVGICLDTGHANIDRIDQAATISQLKNKIKCTHIHNNWGRNDDHAPPVYGNIKWAEIMSAFAKTGYNGPLTLETHCWYENDDMLLSSFAKHNYDSLVYLEYLAKSET